MASFENDFYRIVEAVESLERRMTTVENIQGKIFDRLDKGLMEALQLDKRIDRIEQRLKISDKLIYGAWMAAIAALIKIFT